MTTTGHRWMDIVRLRLRSLWRHGDVEQELDDELRFHYESLVEKFRSKGMRKAEAERMAGIEMGNGMEAIREDCRDQRGWSFLDNLWRDVQYGVRGMLRNPLFTLTAAGALALGIGVNSAVFTMVYSLMYRPLPVTQPETMRNVHVATRGEGARGTFGTPYYVSWVEFGSMRSAARSAELAGAAEVTMSRKDDPRPVDAHLVSDNFLPLMGGRPALGRFPRPEEVSSPGSAAVAVLSAQTWRRWFAADPNIVGKQVVLNRTPFLIIGVADETTTGPLLKIPDVWIPLTMQAVTRPGEPLIERANLGWIQLFGRVRPGFSDDAVQAEMQVAAQNAIRPHLPKRIVTVSVAPAAFFNYPFLKTQGAPLIGILSLAVALVLIVACANVANMLLARGLVRRREIAIRLSIGAGRGRLLQQMLTESLLLALLGGAAGLFLSIIANRLLLLALPGDYVGRHQIDVSPDLRVLLFTLLVASLTGLVFGLAPAWNALRFQPSPHLRSEGLTTSTGARRQRLQFALIAVQAAICVVLLVNAGLLVRGFQSAMQSDPGQLTRGIAVARFDLRQQQYTGEQSARFVEGMRERMLQIPGVRGVSNTFVKPFHQQCGTRTNVIGQDGKDGSPISVECDEVGPDYFHTMGIRMLAGRDFTVRDMAVNAPVVAVVDEEMARLNLPGNPIGQRISFHGKPAEVVGVAAKTKDLNLNDFPSSGKIFTPMRGQRNEEALLVVRHETPFGDVEQGLRKAAASLDSGVNVQVSSVEESIKEALVPSRVASAAAGTLGAFALVLAGTGIYGVVAFAVTRRRKEMGIRVALGADRGGVMRLMIWQGMQPVLVGALAGIVLAGAGAQLIRAMLYGVSPFDPVAFVGMMLVLAIAGILAAAIPARAALSLDPAVTLRQE